MNLQRLKHAWARGALIQARWRDIGGQWIDYIPNGAIAFEFRIHPDDAHLEYGPVSRAFRDMAMYTDSEVKLDDLTEMFLDFADNNWVLNLMKAEDDVDPDHNVWLILDFARLFFAEYLADEGL